MAKLSAIYAAALFDLAMASGAPDEYLQQAVLLRDTLEDAQCRRIIVNPRVSSGEKYQFISSAFAGEINKHLLGFLRLAFEKNRAGFIVPALAAFIDMINTSGKKTTANVVSATPLHQGQITALGELLSKKLDKQVDISAKVEPSVMGGLSIHVDGLFIDQTLKRQLHDMKSTIKRSMAHESKT